MSCCGASNEIKQGKKTKENIIINNKIIQISSNYRNHMSHVFTEFAMKYKAKIYRHIGLILHKVLYFHTRPKEGRTSPCLKEERRIEKAEMAHNMFIV